MPEPGDVALVDFAGAAKTKRRPTVVVSSATYHEHRPDVILATLTTQMPAVTSPTDCVIQDWKDAGLHKPSVFRAYFGMAETSVVKVIGHLSDRDWRAAQECLGRAIAVRMLPPKSGPNTTRADMEGEGREG